MLAFYGNVLRQWLPLEYRPFFFASQDVSKITGSQYFGRGDLNVFQSVYVVCNLA